MQYKQLLSLFLFFALVSIFQEQPNAQATEPYHVYLPVVKSTENLPIRIVGNGSASSCTAAALTAAVQLGGRVQFNCGGGQINIPLTTRLQATKPLLIDGQNRITLDGQNQTGILGAEGGRSVTLKNIKLINSNSGENGGALHVGANIEVWIINTTFENNRSYATATVCEGGGAAYFSDDTQVHIYDSTFRTNQARVGGAIISFGKSLKVYNTTFTGNLANQASRHDVTLDDLLDGRSTGGVCAGGGAVYFGGDDFISHSNKFLANETNQHGGALFIAAQNGTDVDIWRNVFDDNIARLSSAWSGTGGAIWLGERIPEQWDFHIVVQQSAITRNTAHFQGGGVFARIPVTFENVTIAENKALNGSADIGNWQRGGGGGMRVDQSAVVTLRHVTLANNHAGYSGGGLMGAGIHLQNSLIADNSADSIARNCAQTVLDQGGNVQWGETSECHANIPNRDPKLAPLAMNGGFSETMGLTTGSGAIDIANLANCAERDQRNWVRPQGNGCDAGAFEGNGNYNTPTPTPNTPTPIVTTPPPTITPSPTPSGTPPTVTPPTVTPPTVTPPTVTPRPPTITPLPPTVTPITPTPITPTPIVVPGDSIVGNGSAASCTEIEFASAIVNGGHITFNCGSQAHTIRLTRRHILTKNSELDGTGSQIALDGQNNSALLAANSDLTIKLTNLSLINASSDESGAALHVGERTQLTITNVRFQNNVSRALTLTCDGGGAVFADQDSVLQVTGSTFSGNRANNGGAINARRSKFTLQDSTFTTNHAFVGSSIGSDEDCGGGAIYLDGTRTFGGDSVTIQRSDFIGNTAYNRGGALVIVAYRNETRLFEELLFKDNAALISPNASFSGVGGGIWVSALTTGQLGDTTVLKDSSFIGNRAEIQGGGLWTKRPMSIENVTWFGNQAFNPAITDPTNWRGGSGGAFATNNSVQVAVLNNTIVGNTAGYDGGGIYGQNNMLANTIIANNVAHSDNTQRQNCSHTVINLGNNIQYLAGSSAPDPTAASTCHEQIALVNPLLSDPADNGGRTPTMMLNGGSPALDAGSNDSCMEADQRGIDRPQNGTCDIGAVEVVP